MNKWDIPRYGGSEFILDAAGWFEDSLPPYLGISHLFILFYVYIC
jgi:hypothetical protein